VKYGGLELIVRRADTIPYRDSGNFDMTALLNPPPVLPAPVSLPLRTNHGPVQKLWTVKEFHNLAEQGLFEGRRASLIHGIICEEGPMNPPHAIACTKTGDLVRFTFGLGWHIRVQQPLVFGLSMDPQPDLALISGPPTISAGHPSTSPLVIEISDTSLAYDLGDKMSLYAAAGIPEYWVLDVMGRVLHVFRDPRPDTTSVFGATYQRQLSFNDTQSVSPLSLPTASIPVKDCLP
jgi:Uma2 family endonuclease